MRDLIYYIATSLDGFIAHKDGSFDGFRWDDEFIGDIFQNYPETIPAHLHPGGKPPENKCFDTVLMGRSTYEVGLKDGITSPYPSLRQFVFSKSISKSPDPQVELVSENIVEKVRALKAESGKDIWLCGGGNLASQLFTAGLIDQLIIKLNPVVFGDGVPLFSGEIETTALELTKKKAYGSGHLVLYYNLK